MSSEEMSTEKSKLELLVESISFRREPAYLYAIPGAFLAISLPSIAITMFQVVLRGGDIYGVVHEWYVRLATLVLGYALFSAYSSYRYAKLFIKHFVDSGITSYYWLRESSDYESIRALYRAGLLRRELPSPATAFVLTLLSAGLAYPFVLYVLEKNFRSHCIGEERKFTSAQRTDQIDASQLLLDIVVTLLSFGLYMIYWSARPARVYNSHVAGIHGSHPNRPMAAAELRERAAEAAPGVRATLALGALFLSVGVASSLQLLGYPVYPVIAIGVGVLVSFVSVAYSRENFASQVAYTFIAIYLSFALTSIVGFTGLHVYYDLLEQFESLAQVIGEDPLAQLRFIFVNNLAIATISLAPYYGPLYLGLGLGNAGLIYGSYLAHSIFVKNSYDPIVLLVLPHAILELLGYAVFVSTSARIARLSAAEFLKKLLIGVALLLLAALVEVATIQVAS